MEELEFIKSELEKVHMDYIVKAKDIWTNNEPLEAEKMAKREYVKYRNKQKLLELAYSKIESGLEELEYYKRGV